MFRLGIHIFVVQTTRDIRDDQFEKTLATRAATKITDESQKKNKKNKI